MKRPIVLAVMLLAVAGCATPMSDSEFSLNKGSVFEANSPATFDLEDQSAGRSSIPPVPGSGMPPMISHPVASYLPITAAKNDCLACHERTGDAKATVAKGQPKAAPADHYAKTPAGTLAIAGAKYNCLACHAPQAGVDPLVPNRSR